MRKEPTKTGFEVDIICARQMFKYTGKAGVCRKAKRQINRRNRHKWKKNEKTRSYEMTATCNDCGAKFSYTENDIIQDPGIADYVLCHECDREVEV